MQVNSISAVVPTHNDAGRVGDALRAIAGQSRRPEEIIVVDDASSDGTREVVLGFAERDPSLSVRYERLDTRGGVVGARNHGIRLAQGEWIANCDSDDIWLPQKLEQQAAFISAWEGATLSIVATYGYNVNDRGEILSPVTMGPTTEAEYQAIKRNAGIVYLLHASIVFPKACYEAAGGYDDEYGAAEDIDFWTRMSDLGVVITLSEPLVHYRKRSGSVQLAQFANKRDGVARLAANRRRAAAGQAPLSAEEFQAQLDLAPLRERVNRRRLSVGAYHYTTGAASIVNGRRASGLLHLLLASGFDPRLVSAGVKSTLRHRLSSRS